MAAIQLNFSLRTSGNCKTVHLLGSWDNYSGQLPLSKDAAKAGAWKGTFRFQGATLKQGQRYWYYYIVDGYHVSHDPAREFTTEPTTGRKLNILDIPAGKSGTSGHGKATHHSVDIPKGRALSPSRIQSPKPIKPGMTKQIIDRQYSPTTVEALAKRFANQQIDSESEVDSSDDESDVSDVPSLSSRSSNSSTPSSVSSASTCCTCERYGITRAGDRVQLDCGGARCGYSDGSDCDSSSDEEITDYVARSTRRQGVIVGQ